MTKGTLTFLPSPQAPFLGARPDGTGDHEGGLVVVLAAHDAINVTTIILILLLILLLLLLCILLCIVLSLLLLIVISSPADPRGKSPQSSESRAERCRHSALRIGLGRAPKSPDHLGVGCYGPFSELRTSGRRFEVEASHHSVISDPHFETWRFELTSTDRSEGLHAFWQKNHSVCE